MTLEMNELEHGALVDDNDITTKLCRLFKKSVIAGTWTVKRNTTSTKL